MKERYGKEFDTSKIKRSIPELEKIIDECRADSDRLSINNEMGGRCRVCCSENIDHLVTMYSKYHYYECKECGSVFLNGQPNYQNMYQGEDKVNGNFYIDEDIYSERVKMIAVPKVEWVLEVCDSEGIIVHSWLDIGSGGGEILYSLKGRGVAATGIESDQLEYDFSINKGLNVKNLRVDFDNEEVAIQIKNADVVSFFNVLEHVPNPQRFIDYIYDNMKSGAILVCEVPRHPSIASFANLTGKDFTYRHIVPPVHLSVFSEDGIRHLLGNRFSLLGKWCFGQGYTDIINNCVLWSKENGGKLYEYAMNISNKVQKIIDSNGLADQILVVERKL